MTVNDQSGADSGDTIDDPTIAATPGARRTGSHAKVDPGARESPAATTTDTVAPPSGSGLPTKAETGGATFADVLRTAEIQRTRRFVPICTGLAVGIALLLPFLHGHPTAKIVLFVAIVVGIAALLYLYSLTRDVRLYTELRVAAAYLVCIGSLFAAIYYFGVFSAAAAILTLGIFFVGIGRSARVATGLYIAAAAAQATLAVLVVTELIPDYGLITAQTLDWDQQAMVQVGLQMMFFVTYLVGRATRMQLDDAVADHDDAMRQVAKRDALLQEAREQLDRAMKVGGGGRYTKQRFGSFELGNVIGRGAWGEIYEATHTESGEPAAVKMLNMAALGQPGQLTRFLREATAAAKLDSPHVVRLIEVGDDTSPLPYLAMERLHGLDLAQRMREVPPLSDEDIVEMVNHVARGLAAAAAAGIVHRDIKPQNLFCATTADGTLRWKILDFGVSKLDHHQGTLTQGNLVGTPRYMAPEQAQLHKVDHRADLYALGAVAYRALTGQPPFPGGDLPSILYDVVYKMPTRPSELSHLSLDVDRVLAIALAKSPSKRFATALELADAFEHAIDGRLRRPLRVEADALIAEHPWGVRTGD